MLVKYDNKLNLLAFKNVSKLEYDLFFSILARLREKGTQKINISFSELTEFTHKNLTNQEIIKLLDTSTGKIIQTYIRWETESTISKFTIFDTFKIDKDNFNLKVSISKNFEFMLNNLEQGFTILELAEFSSLSSKYSQTLYRLLKQFRYTGKLWIEWDKFIEIMDIPQSYRVKDIDNRVLNIAIKELSEPTLFSNNRLIFKKLFYKKEYHKKRGRPVKAIEFNFMPELRELPKIDHTESLAKATRKEILKEKNDKDKKIIQDCSQEKINPITGARVSLQDEYIFRSVSLQDKNTKEINTLKIIQIQEANDQIIVVLQNVDDDYTNRLFFETKQNFINFFEKYKI